MDPVFSQEVAEFVGTELAAVVGAKVLNVQMCYVMIVVDLRGADSEMRFATILETRSCCTWSWPSTWAL